MYLGNVCISVPQKFLNLLEKSYRRISARWQNRAFQHLSLHRWKKEKKKKKNNVKNIYGWKCLHEGSGIHLKGYSTKVDDRGWDGWITSPTWWTWVWVNSGSWWWTGRPGVLQLMGSQRVTHDWETNTHIQIIFQFTSVLSLSHIRLFATPWIATCQASLSITNSRSSPKLMSIKSVKPSSHLIFISLVIIQLLSHISCHILQSPTFSISAPFSFLF